jgi:hypothetical protein
MRISKVLYAIFNAMIGFVLAATFVIGSQTIVRSFTDSQIIVIAFSALSLAVLYFTVINAIKEHKRVLKRCDDYMMDEAHIRNVLHDWSRNKLTTKQALQQIDMIYRYHYTDNIVIKDGDK